MVSVVAAEAAAIVATKSSVLIFTDGACSGNPGPGGWGAIVYIPSLQKVFELGQGQPQTTNNRMEMQATIEALNLIAKKSPLGEDKICLYTDSTYVIRGITQWIFNWKKRGWRSSQGEAVLNQDLWEKLDQQVHQIKKLGFSLKWLYVRGHSGNPGNERCDQIAVDFSQGRLPELYYGPLRDYGVDLTQLPQEDELPPLANKSSSSEGKTKNPHSYLSYVDGRVLRHKTWAQCEARVKNRSGARFKKAKSSKDEEAILASWGYRGSVEEDEI